MSLPPEDLSPIAMATLRAVRLLSESGCRARVAHDASEKIVRGMGAHLLGLRTGYASLTITVSNGHDALTRMMALSSYGVNHQLDQAVRALILRAEQGALSPAAFEAELDRLIATTPRHKLWVVSLAVGLACAAFGRLFGVDWLAFGPVFLAGALGQFVRGKLHAKGVNVFLIAALVALFTSLLGGIGAQMTGSGTVNLAMMASVLLLVPGVPATNAQADIMDGYPTMGSARAVSVLMIMMFVTTGVWVAQSLLGVRS